jgi:hypothetical protein
VNGQTLVSGAQRADLDAGVTRVDLKAPSGETLVSVEDRSGLVRPRFSLRFASGAVLEYGWSDSLRATWAVQRRQSVLLSQHNHGRLQSLWQAETQVGLLEHTKTPPGSPDHYVLRASNPVSALLLGALVVAYDFYTTTAGLRLGGFFSSGRRMNPDWLPSEFGAPNLAPPAA